MASFPTSIVSFGTKSAGQTIQPSHINDLQDEVTAVETQILTLSTYVPSWGNVTVGNGVNAGFYHRSGNLYHWTAMLEWGTTTSWTAASPMTVTIPATATNIHIPAMVAQGYIFDTSANAHRPLVAASSSTGQVLLATNASPMAAINDGTPTTMAAGDIVVMGGFFWIP